MEKVTVKTIAQACNVSIGTVDRALNGRGRISPETQRKILETAEELGYHRNHLASVLGKQRKYRIAVLSPSQPSSFFRFVDEGVREAQKELMDYGITVEQIHTHFLNYEEQIEALNSIDKSKYDGLVLTASSEKLIGALNAFVDVGIPVVTFNSDARTSRRLFFVGEDAYKSGRMCASLMGRILGGKGRVAVLVSYLHPGSPADRIRGFVDVMKSDYPGIELLEPREYKEREEAAMCLLDEILEEYGRLDGVFANSASGTVGIGRYFSKGQPDKPMLVGYDVTPEVEGYLKSGVCDLIVDQNPEKQSYYGVTLLGKHLMEKWEPQVDQLEIRVKLVMRDNVDDYSPEKNRDEHILL